MYWIEILLRLLLAVVYGGAVGIDRALKNKPAGIRTHALVCLGAAVIALIQTQISHDIFAMVEQDHRLLNIVSIDQSRLISQVVSGVGFLGAGTIVITKRNVVGLTTAATMWAVSALGIAVGMGYYQISFFSFLIIIFALTIFSKLIAVKTTKNLEIHYIHRQQTKEFINTYFENNHIEVEQVLFDVEFHEDYKLYKNTYGITIPNDKTYADIIEDLSFFKNIMKIRLVDVIE